jgi:DNA repair protein RecO (recombination protein O)
LHRYDPHPQLFAAYGSTLEALSGGEGVDEVLRRFEFVLLEELGYGFSLDMDGLSGEAVQAEGWYHYHPDWGLVARGAAMDPAQPAFAGADLLRMAGGDFGGAARGTAKRLLRLVLAAHLGDAPLRSRELFRVQSAAGTATTGPGEQP